MKKLHVNTKNASCGELIIIAKKCGFIVKEGRKHCKVETSDGKFITMIPRHNPVKRETAKSVVASMNQCGAQITFI